MRVCVLGEDEAWFVECEGKPPDCRFHWHWTATRATHELEAERVRLAWRGGPSCARVGANIPNTVVLKSVEGKEQRAYATDWHPKMSEGSLVMQFTGNTREARIRS